MNVNDVTAEVAALPWEDVRIQVRAAMAKRPAAENGDIVAALLDDEATVKTFKRRDGKVWLMPHNPDYEPIDGDHATILGRVTAVLRRI